MEVMIDRAYFEKEDDFWIFVEKLNLKAAEKGINEEDFNRLLDEG